MWSEARAKSARLTAAEPDHPRMRMSNLVNASRAWPVTRSNPSSVSRLLLRNRRDIFNELDSGEDCSGDRQLYLREIKDERADGGRMCTGRGRCPWGRERADDPVQPRLVVKIAGLRGRGRSTTDRRGNVDRHVEFDPRSTVQHVCQLLIKHTIRHADRTTSTIRLRHTVRLLTKWRGPSGPRRASARRSISRSCT
jgi:hypothetical protein